MSIKKLNFKLDLKLELRQISSTMYILQETGFYWRWGYRVSTVRVEDFLRIGCGVNKLDAWDGKKNSFAYVAIYSRKIPMHTYSSNMF